jgi:hypothetical protein
MEIGIPVRNTLILILNSNVIMKNHEPVLYPYETEMSELAFQNLSH